MTLGACPVLAVSALTGAGLDELQACLVPNRTAVLLGSSGVGKSTIVNALAGEELLATQEVRADDQEGRHTTTHRELIVLASGGIVLDTPGMRELQLWDADLGQTFGDVEEIAALPFLRLRPREEPGCAVGRPSPTAPRRPPVGELREAPARAAGARGTAQPPPATGAGPPVQDSGTAATLEGPVILDA